MHELSPSFGKYYLTEKIATGGMAEIFLAKLLGPGGFEKQLVIKQIHPELSDQRAFVDMFVAEAKTLVSLGHGNIVPVYELGMVDEVYFIAMEYIDGPTLRELCHALRDADTRMPAKLAAYVAAEILKGLDYAHRKGVIHRDVSPRNVMLSRDGEVKILDFGIAVHEEPLDRSRERDSHQRGSMSSRSGAARNPVGSYPYMSPEQTQGLTLTAQSDLFSTGILLWEMLVGRDLFARPDAEDTLVAVREATVALPSSLHAGSPAVLDEICARALHRDPAQRYASAAKFLSELNRYLYALDELVTPTQLARFVARYCPPVVRRVDPVSAEASGSVRADGSSTGTTRRPGDGRGHDDSDADRADERPADATRPVAGRTTGRHGTVKLERTRPEGPVEAEPEPEPADPDRRAASGPDTHDAGSSPAARGKVGDHTRPLPAGRRARRPSTVRTFATAAAFEHVLVEDSADGSSDELAADPDREPAGADEALDRSTETHDLPAEHTIEASAPDPWTGRSGREERRSGTTMAQRTGMRRATTLRDLAPADDHAALAPVSLPEARRLPSWSRLGLLAVVLFVGAGVGAAVTLRAGSARSSAPSEATLAAHDRPPVEQADRLPVAPSTAGSLVVAPGPETATPADPTPRPAADAGKPGPDDRGQPPRGTNEPLVEATPRSHDTPRAELTGKLKVGANPWAEVYLDGRKLGRAPGSWSVPAGAHSVDVVFPVAGREQKKTFAVTVKADETSSLGVIDFSDDL